MERLVIIPTYNEKENIEAIITAVMELPLEFNVRHHHRCDGVTAGV